MSGYTLPEDYVGVQDYNGHGTWVASAVAAPINGVGISGVAPNVTDRRAEDTGRLRQRLPQRLVRRGSLCRKHRRGRRVVEHLHLPSDVSWRFEA